MFRNFLKPKEAPPPFKSFGQRLLYGFGALVALAVLAPVAWAALSAITSIAMALVVAAGIFGFLMVLPALHRWWKIIVLKLMKASARRNPVETLELELQRRQIAHQRARQLVVAISGHSEALGEQLADLKRIHKRSDPMLERTHERLSGLANRLKQSVDNAGVKVREFEEFVAFQRDRWAVAKKSGELARMLQEVQQGDVTDRFLENTAIDTIRNELAQSFAAVDDLLRTENIKAIPDGNGKMIEVAPTLELLAPEPAQVGRSS